VERLHHQRSWERAHGDSARDVQILIAQSRSKNSSRQMENALTLTTTPRTLQKV